MRALKILILAVCALLPAAASAQWADNFDSYLSGSQLSGQGGWTSWGGDPGAANYYVSSVMSQSSPNSVAIDGPDDAVHTYSGYTTGQWEYTTYQYIPSSATGVPTYFILLNTYPATVSGHWSLQLEMNPVTNLVSDVDAAVAMTLVEDAWVEIKVVIDLIADTGTVFYNGVATLFKKLVGRSRSGRCDQYRCSRFMG